MMSISETKKKQNTTLALIGQSGPYKYNTLFITQGYNNCVDFINSLYSALHIRSKNLIPILLRPDISKMYIEYDMMYEYIIKQIPQFRTRLVYIDVKTGKFPIYLDESYNLYLVILNIRYCSNIVKSKTYTKKLIRQFKLSNKYKVEDDSLVKFKHNKKYSGFRYERRSQ